VDVSIRPGWYYHPSEDHKVKSVKRLVDIYYHSIGRNASFLLNFPVDRRGLIHERDVEQLMKMVNVIRKDLETDLAKGKKVKAANVRGNGRKYQARKTVDGDLKTYWSTDDGVTSTSLTIDFGEETTFNRFLIQEHIALGQRVKKFSIEAWSENAWMPIDTQTTIGYKRILRFENVTAGQLRLNILESKASPVISNIEVYHAPKLLEPPAIKRDKHGIVTIESFDTGLEVYYTLDGSGPTASSEKYQRPFDLKERGEVRAIALDPVEGLTSSVTNMEFDISKEKWSVVQPAPDKDPNGRLMIDATAETVWRSDPEGVMPTTVIIDLGEALSLSGFTYLPTQARYIDGTISRYRFYISMDGKQWGEPASLGEFSNIRNSPVLQMKTFATTRGRYVRFVAEREINDKRFVTIAELGVITESK
jgi:alpha-L-fucosidase